MKDWDPGQYLRFEGARLAPAMELLARIEVEAPSCAIDAGCGPANVTPYITARWPNARYVGVDSSTEMIARAVAAFPEREWVRADLATWQPDVLVDVLYSNATLHCLENHRMLFPRLVRCIGPGGVLAVQMPHNHAAPSHTAITDVVNEGEWSLRLQPLLRTAPVGDPEEYYAMLRPLVNDLVIWETEYLHVLEGDNAVTEWTKGSVLWPMLAALDARDHEAFLAAYSARVEAAYPRQPDGTTLLPFRRLFMVATI